MATGKIANNDVYRAGEVLDLSSVGYVGTTVVRNNAAIIDIVLPKRIPSNTITNGLSVSWVRGAGVESGVTASVSSAVRGNPNMLRINLSVTGATNLQVYSFLIAGTVTFN